MKKYPCIKFSFANMQSAYVSKGLSTSFLVVFFLFPTVIKAQSLEVEELATPDKTVLYSIKTNIDRFDGKVTKVLRTNPIDGSEVKLEVGGKEGFGKNLQVIICDNRYLFFVTTEDGLEAHEKKKINEKLVLNRYDHVNFQRTKFVVATPPIEGGDQTCFWSFVGQSESTKYFSYKRIDEKLTKVEFVILGVSSDGEVVSTTKFATSLGAGSFTRPFYNVSEPRNSIIARRLDYLIRVSTNNSGGMRSSYERTLALPTAHAQVIFDNQKERFLVYGLFGDAPFKPVASQYKGLHLSSYDLAGNKSWSVQQPAGPKLMGEGFFRVHGTPGDRNLEVFSVPQEKIVVVVSFNNVVAPYLFTSEGKFLKSDLIKSNKNSSFDINSFIK